MSDEKKLLFALQSGKKERIERVFEEIYIQYKPYVAAIVSTYVADPSAVDDQVSECFLDFFNHAGDITTTIKGYLMASAKNHAINYAKRASRIIYTDEVRGETPFEREAIEDRLFAKEVIKDLYRKLSQEDADILMYHLFWGHTFPQISLMLGQNERTVKTKYYRALKKYQKEVGK